MFAGHFFFYFKMPHVQSVLIFVSVILYCSFLFFLLSGEACEYCAWRFGIPFGLVEKNNGGGVTCVVFCVDGRLLCCLNSCKSWLSGLVQTLHHLHLLRIRDILFCIVAMSCCHPPYAAFKVIEEVSTGERSIVEWWEVPCRNGCSCRRARCPFWHSKSSSWYKVVAFSHEESLIISLRQGHVTLACSL